MGKQNLHILSFNWYNQPMRPFLPAALAGAAVFLMLSCGSVDSAKKYPNMAADADPVSAGTIEAEFDRLFSLKLNKNEVGVVFYPRLNAVALEFKYQLATYRQFWDQNMRKQFAEALDLYKEDYTERNLVDRYGKTRAAYGKTKGCLEWETFKFGKTRVSYPVIELGYRFREEAPFFATLMRPAKEVEKSSAGNNRDDRLENMLIHMYFTRAQADDLAKLFDQDYLMGLLGEQGRTQPDEGLVLDEYRKNENPPFIDSVAE